MIHQAAQGVDHGLRAKLVHAIVGTEWADALETGLTIQCGAEGPVLASNRAGSANPCGAINSQNTGVTHCVGNVKGSAIQPNQDIDSLEQGIEVGPVGLTREVQPSIGKLYLGK
jgi:hypothetical protein